MIELSIDELEYYMYELQKKNRVIIDNNRYFLKEYYVAEKNISETLYYLTNKKDTKYKNINNEIDNTELYFDIEYNDEQRKAIKNALEKNLVVITGGPGTGKTTIIKGIVEVFKKVHNSLKNNLQSLNVRSNILHGRFSRLDICAPLKRPCRQLENVTMTMLIS